MFTLNTLNFKKEALEPYMSAQTLDFHHDKHHQAYVDNLNRLIKDTEMENMNLEDVILKTYSNSELQAVFNNAAQVYNHDLFWQVLSPVNESKIEDISQELLNKIDDNFQSLENFKEEFKKIALSQFGSGWIWLVFDKGELKIEKSSNAENPLVNNQKPIFCLDVWEHSYYLDYQNKRGGYVEAVLNNLVNWKRVSELYQENINN